MVGAGAGQKFISREEMGSKALEEVEELRF